MEGLRKIQSLPNVSVVCGKARNGMEGTCVLELGGSKHLSGIITILFNPVPKTLQDRGC